MHEEKHQTMATTDVNVLPAKNPFLFCLVFTYDHWGYQNFVHFQKWTVVICPFTCKEYQKFGIVLITAFDKRAWGMSEGFTATFIGYYAMQWGIIIKE